MRQNLSRNPSPSLKPKQTISPRTLACAWPKSSSTMRCVARSPWPSSFRVQGLAVGDQGGERQLLGTIPPLANKKEADAKAAELKKLQVQEYFVIQENGPNNHAISLGLFPRGMRPITTWKR